MIMLNYVILIESVFNKNRNQYCYNVLEKCSNQKKNNGKRFLVV